MTRTGAIFNLFPEESGVRKPVRVGTAAAEPKTVKYHPSSEDIERFWSMLHNNIKGGRVPDTLLKSWLEDIAKIRPADFWLAVREYVNMRNAWERGRNLNHEQAIAELKKEAGCG